MTMYERLIDMRDKSVTSAIDIHQQFPERRPSYLLGYAHAFEVAANLLTIEQAESAAIV